MIDLTDLKLRASPPQLVDFGGSLTPPLGGARQRIDRIGTRWAFAFETPSMAWEPDGRIWSTRLSRAKTEGAVITVPEPGLGYVGATTATVSGAGLSAGSQLYVSNASAFQAFFEGKWLSIIHDARRYLYRVAANGAANGSGQTMLSVFPMIRSALAPGDVIELAKPKMQAASIEGDFGWPMEVEGVTSFGFTLMEDE